MGEALLMLLERLVMSPVAQQEAWDIIKPHLMSGQPIGAATLVSANQAADRAIVSADA